MDYILSNNIIYNIYANFHLVSELHPYLYLFFLKKINYKLRTWLRIAHFQTNYLSLTFLPYPRSLPWPSISFPIDLVVKALGVSRNLKVSQ
jgi:hypothetical protein